MARTGQVEPVERRPQSMGCHRAPRGLADIRMLWPPELSDADVKEPLTMCAERRPGLQQPMK
jgi:hypothetical protein